jgi:hypothetical protein
MAGWKTIGTAPRDAGRPLLLYPRPTGLIGPSYTAVSEGYWDGEVWRMPA